jgi:hypothetical protein
MTNVRSDLANKIFHGLTGTNPQVVEDTADGIRVLCQQVGAALISIDYTADAADEPTRDAMEWIVGVSNARNDEAIETVRGLDAEQAVRLARAMWFAASLAQKRDR